MTSLTEFPDDPTPLQSWRLRVAAAIELLVAAA
jgi:hypothetical protein